MIKISIEEALSIFEKEAKKSNFYLMRKLPFYDMGFMVILTGLLRDIYYRFGIYDDSITDTIDKLTKLREVHKYIKLDDKYLIVDFHLSLLINVYKVALEIKNGENNWFN